MTTNEYLDAIKRKLGIRSEYGLAKALNTQQSHIRGYRKGNSNFNDEMALRVADLLEIDPVMVLADMNAARTKCPEARAVWERIARSCSTAANFAVAVVLATFLFVAASGTASAAACDALYLSPIAFSKHWAGGNYNEVHPGVTAECRAGRLFVSAGRMRNSMGRRVELVSAGAHVRLTDWIGARVGAIAGRYDNTTSKPYFLSPLLALTLADDRRVALDVMHMPSNRLSPSAVTMIAVRIKLW